MDWLSIIISVVSLIGLGVGLFFAAQSPGFMVGLAEIAVKLLIPVILKRKTPEEEAKWRDRIARGQSGQVDRWGRETGHDK